MLVIRHNKYYCNCKPDYEERCQVISEKLHAQYFSDYKSDYMEIVALDKFNKFNPSTVPMEQLYSHLSDKSYHDYITTATHL